MKDNTFYFDVLPIHPPPERLEALSSYVVRLAKANGINLVSRLTETFFPDYFHATRHLHDFPLHSPQGLQLLANCTKVEIQATTFYYFGEKFGRTYHPNSCYLFLEKSIADHARYCPYCLKERGYYSLLWRFQPLKGCSEHGCYLLDTCCHCNRSNLVFPYKSLVASNTCSNCLKDLGDGQSLPLPPEELEETRSFSQDLIFLLSPLPQNAMITSPEYYIGKQFTHVRQAKRLSVQDLAQRTMLRSRSVMNVEFAFPNTYSTSFECYFQCAKTLGVSFRSIFEGALAQWHNEEILKSGELQISEEEVIGRVQQAISILTDSHKPLSQQAAFKLAHLLDAPVIPSSALLQKLGLMFRNGCVEQRQKTHLKNQKVEQEIFEVTIQLQEAGIPVNYHTIRDIMKFPYSSFKEDIWDIRALNTIIARLLCRQRNLTEEEDVWMTKIEIACEQLEEIGKPIRRGDVLNIVGSREEFLSHHPRVKLLLENIPTFLLTWER